MGSRSGHSHPHPKLKPPTRALFSCGMFRNCTQTVLSPTTTTPPTPPPPSSGLLPPSSPPPPPPPTLPSLSEPDHAPGATPAAAAAAEREATQPSSSSSSSSSTSQSFTQWRFPLTHPLPESEHRPPLEPDFAERPSDDFAGMFRAAELHLASGNLIPALRLLERALVRDPGAAAAAPCPPSVMAGVVASVLDPAAARPAAKVLLALLLAEGNRRPAVEAGASSAVVEAVKAASASGAAGATTAERALAALELICTVPEGAAEVRRNAGAAGALVWAVERLSGRGRECAIGVLAATYGGEWAAAAAAEVGRTVVMALQGECSARGRRKGAQLLKALKDAGRLDLPEDAC